jgi:hypothetical protein
MDPNQHYTTNRLWQALGKPGLGTGMWVALGAIAAGVLVLWLPAVALT